MSDIQYRHFRKWMSANLKFMDVSQCRQNENGCLTSKIDDFVEWAIQNVSGHPNSPSDIQIVGQIWMSDIFKFACHTLELFHNDVSQL